MNQKTSVKSGKKNVMRAIYLEKVSVNIGVGEAGDKLEKAVKLLEILTGQKPVKTKSNKRLPNWGVRPGLAIGTKVTLRGSAAFTLLKRLLESVDNTLRSSQVDRNGNLNFGIRSYIDIPDMRYEPDIGVYGLSVSAVLTRKGFSIKNRAIKKSKVGTAHLIKRDEGVDFFKNNFKVIIK